MQTAASSQGRTLSQEEALIVVVLAITFRFTSDLSDKFVCSLECQGGAGSSVVRCHTLDELRLYGFVVRLIESGGILSEDQSTIPSRRRNVRVPSAIERTADEEVHALTFE